MNTILIYKKFKHDFKLTLSFPKENYYPNQDIRRLLYSKFMDDEF